MDGSAYGLDFSGEGRIFSTITNTKLCKCGRGERIRTSDHLHPMQVRYQAALRPEFSIMTHSARKEKNNGLQFLTQPGIVPKGWTSGNRRIFMAIDMLGQRGRQDPVVGLARRR